MENCTDIWRPMQKEFKENFCYEIEGDFYPKLNWEYFVVIIKHQ